MQRDRHRPQSMAEDGPRERTARRRDKFSERQAELADAALETLAELGYARTSLREIAQHSAFSHGVLHYYFHDKVELILCGLRQYRARCVAPCDRIAVDDCRFDELLDGFAERLAARLRDEARLHRLWYDLRAQALFEAAFRPDVAEIERSLSETVWRVVRRLADLQGRRQTLSPSLCYALVDGLFQQQLLRHLAGDAGALDDLRCGARELMLRLVGTAPAAHEGVGSAP